MNEEGQTEKNNLTEKAENEEFKDLVEHREQLNQFFNFCENNNIEKVKSFMEQKLVQIYETNEVTFYR